MKQYTIREMSPILKLSYTCIYNRLNFMNARVICKKAGSRCYSEEDMRRVINFNSLYPPVPKADKRTWLKFIEPITVISSCVEAKNIIEQEALVNRDIADEMNKFTTYQDVCIARDKAYSRFTNTEKSTTSIEKLFNKVGNQK